MSVFIQCPFESYIQSLSIRNALKRNNPLNFSTIRNKKINNKKKNTQEIIE